jgi:hypothetical protein
LEVGDVMVTAGSVTPTPIPVTSREIASPSALKLTLVFTVAEVVGVKRTVTVWVAPNPARLNGLPDTMLKGAEVDAVPETVPPRVFCTVKVWFAKVPIFTLPKFTGPFGLTEKSTCARPFAASEQALSLPLRSTALTET